MDGYKINDVIKTDPMNKAKLKIQTAIMRKNLLAFEYTDKSSPRSGLRIIEPYLFGADKKGNYL